MMTESKGRSVSAIVTPPPTWLAARTEERCLAALRAPRRQPIRVPRWEWLVYATSMLICGGYAVQMTWAKLNDPVVYVALRPNQ